MNGTEDLTGVPGVRGLIRRNLIAVFLVALIGGAGGFYVLLRAQALGEAKARAEILLSSATGVRTYTDTHILPLATGAAGGVFHEETVPSFAAQTVFHTVSAGNSAYAYREAALNPTSTADRASPFDVALIQRFRAEPTLKEISGFRADGAERQFYLARPIRIDDPQCLACHDIPARAPASMLAKYGSSNGFGWQLHEIVGVQTLSVPVAQQFAGMLRLVGLLAAGLLAVFVVAYFALAISLDALLVEPLRDLAAAAEGAGRGDPTPLPVGGVAELRTLSTAITRLGISLRKALERLAAWPDPEEP